MSSKNHDQRPKTLEEFVKQHAPLLMIPMIALSGGANPEEVTDEMARTLTLLLKKYEAWKSERAPRVKGS